MNGIFYFLVSFPITLVFASGNWHWNGVFGEHRDSGRTCRYSLGRGIIGETRTPTNGAKLLFGRRKHDILHPVNHVDEGPVYQELGAASE